MTDDERQEKINKVFRIGSVIDADFNATLSKNKPKIAYSKVFDFDSQLIPRLQI